jgi:tRNA uridine 5-carbamoylmethylation protein Kti12
MIVKRDPMNLITSIYNLIKQVGRQRSPDAKKTKGQNDTIDSEADSQRMQNILDGMSTGSARIIIDREASRRVSEDYSLQGLQNKGRYFVARIVRTDGSVIDELLVDKQNGRIQFLVH